MCVYVGVAMDLVVIWTCTRHDDDVDDDTVGADSDADAALTSL
jgi:hypothetical protein